MDWVGQSTHGETKHQEKAHYTGKYKPHHENSPYRLPSSGLAGNCQAGYDNSGQMQFLQIFQV